MLAAALPAKPAWAAASVDVNRATQAELETVPGIGPSLSAKILAARQGKPFADWNDLVDRVVGVGPRSAVRLSEAGLTVAGAPYAGAPAAAARSSRSSAAPKSAAAAGAGGGAGAMTR